MIGKRVLSLFRRRKSIGRSPDVPVTPTEGVEESRQPPSILLELQQTHEKKDSMPEIDLEEVMEWEPDKQTVEALKTMNVALDEFKHEALRLALEEESKREIFRSADKLVSKMEESDLDRRDAIRLSLAKHLEVAVHEIRKLRTPEPPKKPEQTEIPKFPRIRSETTPPHQLKLLAMSPAQPQPKLAFPGIFQSPTPQPKAPTKQPELQTVKTITEQPRALAETVPYDVIIRGEIEPKTAYLLPIRSAMPSALIASLIKGKVVVNVERHEFGENRVKPLPNEAVLVLTRPAYRSEINVKKLLASPKQKYISKLKRMLKHSASQIISVIITEEMYEIDEEIKKDLERLGFKIKKVKLDEEKARKALERIMGPLSAAKLAKTAALLPWLPEKLEKAGIVGVKEQLQLMDMNKQDKDEVSVTIENAYKGYQNFSNNRLAECFGLIPSLSNRRQRRSKYGPRSFVKNLNVNEWLGNQVSAFWLFYAVYLYLLALLLGL